MPRRSGLKAKSETERLITPLTVDAARDGCEQAWCEIYLAQQPRLIRYFAARVPTEQEAEDLTANVFLQAFRGIRQFRWRGRAFEAWLSGIARHELASFYREQEREAILPDASPDDAFLAVEIEDILSRLSLDHREAIELRWVKGLSGAEAAAVMGRSHSAFRSLLLRAARAFQQESADSGSSRAATPAPRRDRHVNSGVLEVA